MKNKVIIIDNISIHLPNGWQGDPQLLARQVSEQVQKQAHNLHSSKQIQVNLQGHYASNTNLIMPQLSKQLINHSKKSKRDNQ